MAPSPTGEYHIGSIRTMLYNYAFARQNDGQFILRIEDTDRNRLVPGALERMLGIIKEYGLSWDEGPEVGGKYAPYIQSERLEIYEGCALKLVEEGLAYYCFCSEERLQKIREEQRKAKSPVTKYDKFCRDFSKQEVVKKLESGEKYVIRFKMPENETVSFNDLFLGQISFNTKDLEDYILLKSDGFPTYHLAVVVDDYKMKISHVLRGVEWLPSTPKHILLYKAFGWEMPLHGHLPNLKELGENKKLSKRSGTVDASIFLAEGYLPEAMLNFLMFLGWNPGGEREIYSLKEFISEFSLERVHKSDLVAFDREKLLWFNGHYIRNLSVEDLYERLVKWSKKYNFDLALLKTTKDYSISAITLVKDRARKLADFEYLTSFFFEAPEVNEELMSKYSGGDEKTKTIVSKFNEVLSSIDTSGWNKDNLDKRSHELLTTLNLTPKEAFMTLRVVLTGREATPPLFEVMELLGKKVVLERLKGYI